MHRPSPLSGWERPRDSPGFGCSGAPHADFGSNWSVSLELRSTHRLVTHDVQRLVRHPMYAAFILFGIAQALLLPNWIAGSSALVAVALPCAVRIPNE